MSIDTYSPADLAEMRSLIGRMEQLLALPAARAAVNPDGTPGHVVAGELIESAWGNAVVDTLADASHVFGAAGKTVSIGNGAELEVASLIANKPGQYLLLYAGLPVGDFETIATIRAYVDGTRQFDTTYRGRLGTLQAFTNITVGSPGSVNVRVLNGAAPSLDFTADGNVHRLTVIRTRTT